MMQHILVSRSPMLAGVKMNDFEQLMAASAQPDLLDEHAAMSAVRGNGDAIIPEPALAADGRAGHHAAALAAQLLQCRNQIRYDACLAWDHRCALVCVKLCRSTSVVCAGRPAPLLIQVLFGSSVDMTRQSADSSTILHQDGLSPYLTPCRSSHELSRSI